MKCEGSQDRVVVRVFELYDYIALGPLQGDKLSVLSAWPGPKLAAAAALGSWLSDPPAKVPVCQELV